MNAAKVKRATRVAEEIKRELGTLIQSGVKDPRVGFVTVTEVRLSDDLKHARVYVSILGGDPDQGAIRGLGSAAGYLRAALGRRLALRHLPSLTFIADHTLDRAERIGALIATAKGETLP